MCGKQASSYSCLIALLCRAHCAASEWCCWPFCAGWIRRRPAARGLAAAATTSMAFSQFGHRKCRGTPERARGKVETPPDTTQWPKRRRLEWLKHQASSEPSESIPLERRHLNHNACCKRNQQATTTTKRLSSSCACAHQAGAAAANQHCEQVRGTLTERFKRQSPVCR